MVAAGILLSRLVGLARQRVFAYFFGNSAVADALAAAFRIPNLLQNLFGEGALSASFIPVYAGLVARGETDQARRVAGAVAALLGLVVSILVLAGVLGAAWLVDLLAPGFSGDTRELTIVLVRILFPGVGLLVLSAWCLGVLNSHRRFFLSYAAPVVWNLAIIAALLVQDRGTAPARLAVVAAWGSVAGSGLQLVLQLPSVLGLLGGLSVGGGASADSVRTVVRNFFPTFLGRGVVQISAYVDTMISTLLPTGAASALYYAQIIYTLPVSLFGMSVSAAELPEMASARGSGEEIAAALRTRLAAGLQQIAFFIVPSAMAFAALGHVVAGALYQTGRFGRQDSLYVWGVLAGSAVGLLAATLGRLYSSAYYALHDTRTPMRFAILRVALGSGLGFTVALYGPALVGIAPRWGVAGLTAASGVAAWVEFALLRRGLERRIGRSRIPGRHLVRLWSAAAAAAAAAWAVLLGLGVQTPLVQAIFVLGTYGAAYLALTLALGVPQARSLLGRLVPARGSDG